MKRWNVCQREACSSKIIYMRHMYHFYYKVLSDAQSITEVNRQKNTEVSFVILYFAFTDILL